MSKVKVTKRDAADRQAECLLPPRPWPVLVFDVIQILGNVLGNVVLQVLKWGIKIAPRFGASQIRHG